MDLTNEQLEKLFLKRLQRSKDYIDLATYVLYEFNIFDSNDVRDKNKIYVLLNQIRTLATFIDDKLSGKVKIEDNDNNGDGLLF